MKIKDLVLKEIKGFWGEEPAENEKGIPVIKTNNLTYEGVINYSDLCYRSIDVNKVKDNFLIKGDLLIEKSGGTKTHSVGYVSYFDGTENTYVCNNFILGLRINENIVRPKYIFYILKYMYENGYFAHCYKQTTGIQNLKKDLYLDFDIQVPDFQTQDNIINILDKITTSTTKDQQKLKKYDDLVKSQFIEMFGDVNTNPKHWEMTKLQNICSSIVRGPFGSALKKEFFVEKNDTTYKVYEQKNAIQKSEKLGTYYITKEKYEELKRFECKPNDFIMSCSGTMGELYQLPASSEKGIINQALCKFTLNGKMNSTVFLELMKDAIRNIETKGSGIQNIASVIYIKNLDVYVPPIELQNQFADFVKHIDKLKFTIKQSVEKLELCYKSLMKQYFE